MRIWNGYCTHPLSEGMKLANCGFSGEQLLHCGMQVSVVLHGINEVLTVLQGTWSALMHSSRRRLSCKHIFMGGVCALIPARRLYAIPEELLNKSFQEQLDAMEEYWDSEVPRLGEPEASGWAACDASRHEHAPRPTKSVVAAPYTSDPYSKWATAEAHADRTRVMSHRSTDEDELADPYAIVLFSDIRPLLLCLRSPRAKDVFRRIWLAFLGLHIPGFLASLSEHPEDNSDDRWAYSHFAMEPYLLSLFPPTTSARRISADAQAGAIIGREREFESGFGPVKNWGCDVIAPLETQGSARWTMWSTQDVQGVHLPLVREIFQHCRLEQGDPGWDVLALAVEAAVDVRRCVTMKDVCFV